MQSAAASDDQYGSAPPPAAPPVAPAAADAMGLRPAAPPTPYVQPAPQTVKDLQYPLKGGPKTQRLADGTLVSEDDYPYPYAEDAGAAPVKAGSAPPQLGLVDPSNPYKLPPEAATVIGVIRSHEGTANRQGYTLFGGQQFVPGYEHPADEGWRGDRTQYGPTHAAGPGQWQPDAWHDEVARAKAAGINLDFGKGADQDWAIFERASRIYHNATGRDLVADQKAGKVDWKALGGEWQGLLAGTGSKTVRGWATGQSPYLQQQGKALTDEADRLHDQYHEASADLMRQANQAAPGSRERDNLIAELRQRERTYTEKYEAIANHPPAYKPVDALEQFGSAGFIIAMLGGLFARNHMTAALSAAGQAMQAANQNHFEDFQRQYKLWEQSSSSALQMVKLHAEEIREIIEDKRLSEDEKNTRLRFAFEAQGNNRAADMMAIGQHERVYTEQAGLERAAQSAAQQRQLFMDSTFNMLYTKYKTEGMQDAEAWTRAGRESGKIPPNAGTTMAPKNITVYDKDGKEIFKGAAMPNKSGGYMDAAGKPVSVPEGGRVALEGTSGNRVQPQVQRLIGAGSQMEAHLQNLSEMPIDANIGPLMGIESKTPDGLTDALRRTIARRVATGDAAQAMQVEFIGVSRQIAALDSQGAAQGLVGLSHQAEGYAPLPTDSTLTVMRKYASLRQVVEQAMSAIKASGTANPDQKKGADEILASIHRSIPWTVHDVNMLQFPPAGDTNKAARAVADRILRHEGSDAPAKAIPTVSNQEEYDKLPTGATYVAPDGKRYTKQ